MAPRPYSVSRSIQIDAAADHVLSSLVDFREWRHWSPWEGMDPDLRRTYSGPGSGAGAQYSWTGNRKAGAGTMTITEVDAARVEIVLAFTKPMKSQSLTVFALVPTGEATVVTWTMSGANSGLAKIFSSLVPMDRLVGGDFEKGLVALKSHVEKSGAR
ncbi:SRPBCC family protein [Williamsia sp. CHRR-6]|uniref:SRPBCC family protein n=1 Tax=Williamsia sp. CHRR-6 TaxID=2835871 RepID=UPI001BDB63BB|nr:SRPBCC family protein [Williamsia sp. CHRR-6]MBT0568413.1 SRPBCC family protein [Williamsia sp. CHRR-6]